MNAIWFSRHRPTQKQLDEIMDLGFTLVSLDEGMALGGINITSENINDVVRSLKELIFKNKAMALFGVFPVPMLSSMKFSLGSGRTVCCVYSAWNLQRSVEGGSPTFEHYRFMTIGLWMKED